MHTIKNILITFFVFFYLVGSTQSDGYYDNAENLTGDDLRQALHDIIKDHKEYSYNDLRDFILKNTDEDPNNPDNVILLYSGISRAKDDFGGNVGEWNREHTWAKSHGDFGNTPPEGTDAHHVRPSDVQINSARGNLDFDNGGSPVPGCPGCNKDADSFEPRDEVKGDVARMLFYMATRYMGGSGELFLNVVDEVNTSPEPMHGKLSTLLEWNVQDPPDSFEINRNNVVFSYQENRNPFIDNPEYVNEIWGDPTSTHDMDELVVSYYPNPVKDKLVIQINFSSTLSYSIVGTDGRTIETGDMYGDKTTINFSNKNPGLYLLILQNENGEQIRQIKLIKTMY